MHLFKIFTFLLALACVPAVAHAADFFIFLDCADPTTIGRLIWQHITASIFPPFGGIYWGAATDCGLWGWLYWLGFVNVFGFFVVVMPIAAFLGFLKK